MKSGESKLTLLAPATPKTPSVFEAAATGETTTSLVTVRTTGWGWLTLRVVVVVVCCCWLPPPFLVERDPETVCLMNGVSWARMRAMRSESEEADDDVVSVVLMICSAAGITRSTTCDTMPELEFNEEEEEDPEENPDEDPPPEVEVVTVVFCCCCCLLTGRALILTKFSWMLRSSVYPITPALYLTVTK